MDKLFERREPQGVEALLDKIFHGLDVVVGDAFDLLDTAGIIKREVAVDVAQRLGKSL